MAGLLLYGCRGAEDQTVIATQDGKSLVSCIKIYTLGNGVYGLRASDLRDAGMAIDDLAPAKLTLYQRGNEWPLWYTGQGSDLSLRFYAQASDSMYSAENIYILCLGEAPSPTTSAWDEVLDIVPQGDRGEAASYLETARVEQNLYYFPQVKEEEHWFWQAVPAAQQADFELAVDGLLDGAANIRVNIWSGTQADVSPDHHLRISVNGQQVADETWDGSGWHLVQTEIPEGVLVDGSNWVRLDVPGDTGAPAETNLLDWIEIEYPRQPVSRSGMLRLQGLTGGIVLDGFHERVMILNITIPSEVFIVAATPVVGGQVDFWGESGVVYYAVDESGLLQPERLTPAVNDPLVADAALGADYLAIGPAELLAPLTPLLERRAQQGMQVASIPAEVVYDQFNDGFPEPKAISAFLLYLFEHNGTLPRFLLLAGDASYDPLGYIASSDSNRLPTYFVQTAYGGQTASDVLFGDVDGDLLPDLAVGRVPAGQPEQVALFVGKTLAYEDSLASGDWQQRVLAVADGQEESFRHDAQAFIDELADPYEAELFSPDAGVSGAGQTIGDAFQEGYGLVVYFGHGSLTMWGKDRLFTVEDVGRMTNEHLPVVINMTCLAGLYTHPSVLSLAESMLWQPDGGAVAVLAPTSLTLSYDQSYWGLPLARALTQGEYVRLGEAYLAAQRQMPVDHPGGQDVLQTFLLFGDPALMLPNVAAPAP